MLNAHSITKTFILAIIRSPYAEQILPIKVKYAVGSSQQTKNEPSELLSGYSVI